MADGKIKISELTSALQISDTAKFPYSQDNSGTETTYGAEITQIARKIAEGIDLTNLQTTAKTLVGAINEIAQGGGGGGTAVVLYGTTAPTSSQGSNGNLYVQYTAGIGGADDTVDALFVKLDGAWCEIETGGGSGTTDYEDLSNKPQVNSVELVGNKSLDDLGIMPALLSKTASGSIAHFTDGADNIPVKSLVSEIVAVETGSGEKSPENPYIISGFDSGVITVFGLYPWDEQWEVGSYNSSLQTVVKVTDSTHIRSKNPIPVFPNTTYYMNSAGYNVHLIVADVNGNVLYRTVSLNNGTFTTPSNSAFVYFNMAQAYGTTYNNDISINYPSSDTQYHAYNGNTYTFAFGQTVYGGLLDVTTGVLTIDRAIVDMGTLSWTKNTITEGNLFRSGNLSTALTYNSLEAICEIYPTVKASERTDISLSVGSNNKVDIIDNNYSDAATFKTAVTGHNICYPLETPITVQLTPTEVKTLLGENNIFSNTGDVEVTYYTNNSDDIVDLIKSAGSGGHTIVDSEGTSLTQRTNLQFKGAYSVDDSTNSKTVVNIVRSMTKSEFDQLSDAEKVGFINVTDETGSGSDIVNEVIYQNTSTTNPQQIDLSSAYTNYDFIIIRTKRDVDSRIYLLDRLFNCNGLALNSVIQDFGWGASQNYWAYTITSETQLTLVMQGQAFYIYEIYGIKIGANSLHNYSTDEQIVGKWIDGKTLYEKTVTTGGSVPTGAILIERIVQTGYDTIRYTKT